MDPEVKIQLEKIKEYIENMPTFSPATHKIVQLAGDMNASPNEIVKAIRMDPILTGKIFKLINSTYYNLPDKVTSLNRAVIYIGINTVKNIALSSAVMGAVSTQDAALVKKIAPVWRHSLAAAVCTKLVAKALGIPKNMWEEYFIVGLLHDIGKIVLIQCFNGDIEYDGLVSISKEQDLFGLAHTELGYVILKRWNFPKEMSMSVNNHHTPREDMLLSNIIYLADLMTYHLKLNSDDPEETEEVHQMNIENHPIDPEIWTFLNTDLETIKNSLENAAQDIKDAQAFLDTGG